MPNKPTTLTRDIHTYLVIECPNRCAGMGCQHDNDGSEWRTSKELGSSLVIEQARTILDEHAARYPDSGPYRLVAYTTTTTKTMEIL